VHDTRRTRLVLGVLLVAALALITVSYRASTAAPVRALRGAGASVFGRVESAVSAVTDPVARFFDGQAAGSSPSPQVSALERQVIQLRSELSQATLSQADYRQLHRLLALAGQGRYRIVAATVIAYGQGYQQTVTLDAGSKDGVRSDETVLDGQGLVGRVTAVSAQTCTVLLATDATSTVGVRLAGSGQVGWVTGTGKATAAGGLLRLQVPGAGTGLRPGQQMVTTASVRDRPFVPGVPVGTITRVEDSAGGLTAVALVRPFADFGALNVVGIVVAPPRTSPRFSVLPPIPKPAPTVTVTVTPRAARRAGRGTPAPSGSPSPAPGTGG
jgi:rod shape-determining protein MreC